ncbi:MAG: hypothetical protein ABI175_07555 [Polyangiales bacterium]
MRALLIVLIASSVAGANPVLVDSDPDPNVLVEAPRPPPKIPREPFHTRLGWRIGMGKLPIGAFEVSEVGLIQLTGDLQLGARTRAFAEYELLFISANTPPMSPNIDAIGHRGDLGLL